MNAISSVLDTRHPYLALLFFVTAIAAGSGLIYLWYFMLGVTVVEMLVSMVFVTVIQLGLMWFVKNRLVATTLLVVTSVAVPAMFVPWTTAAVAYAAFAAASLGMLAIGHGITAVSKRFA